jgi:UDP-N-acetylmuramoyl-tripeptide--D-alanyl-D-alanine ligase
MTTDDLIDLFHRCRSISTDTRQVQAGDLFFALRGERFDGNKFAAQALEKGARAVVIDNPEYLVAGDERYILVADSLQSLQDLGRARRREFTIPFLGITGSNGKTTTKELIYSVLHTEKRVFATQGNYNNHIGVPLTLLALPDELDIAVIEMGANQPGDIAELAAIAEPTHGLITNVGRAHLERLGSLDGVRKTKGALFDFVVASGGHIFLNLADEHVVRAGQGATAKTTFGTKDADWFLELKKNALDGMEMEIHARHWDQPLTVRSQISGTYNATNILVAAMVGDYFGISQAGIQQGIASYSPSNNRSQVVRKGDFLVWLDAYNANPSSMRAAISHVFATQPEKVVLVLGDMFEMGEEEWQIHAELGHFINQFRPLLTIGIGPRMKAMCEALQQPVCWFENTEEAAAKIADLVHGAEILLIKGSRGMALERLLERI